MKISRTNLLKLGIFIVIGLIIFIGAIYYLGRQQNIFRTGIPVYTEFRDVKGLQTGNNVRYLGTYAGYVSSIRIISDTIVRVEMNIITRMSEFIRENSRVEIQNDGVMGSKIAVIHPGTVEYNTIQRDSRLPSLSSMSIEEIFGALEGTVDYTTRAAQNLWLVSEKVMEGSGIMGRMMFDQELEQTIVEFIDNLAEISRETNQIVNKMNRSDSDLGRLLNEDQISMRIIQSFETLDTLLLNMAESTQEIKKATQAINNEEGVINKFLYDRQFANEVDTTVTNMNNAIHEVMETSEVIRRSWIFNLFSRGSR